MIDFVSKVDFDRTVDSELTKIWETGTVNGSTEKEIFEKRMQFLNENYKNAKSDAEKNAYMFWFKKVCKEFYSQHGYPYLDAVLITPESFKQYIADIKSYSDEELWAKKTGCVSVRPAKEGEVIDTVLADGTVEVTETAQMGQVCVTAVDSFGEPILNSEGKPNRWFMDSEKFNKTYDVNEHGLGVPKVDAKPEHFVKAKYDVVILKPWGKNGDLTPQIVQCGSYFNVTDPDHIHGVGFYEFNRTYTKVDIEKEPKSLKERLEEIGQKNKGSESDVKNISSHVRDEKKLGNGEERD